MQSKKNELFLISCTKLKKDYKCKAKELYSESTYFKKMWKFASQHTNNVSILSAKHGFLDPNTEISPYNETLKNFKEAEKKEWAINVFEKMESKGVFENISEITLLMGEDYKKYLKKFFNNEGIKVKDPLKGLGIGEKLSWLTKKIK